MRLAALLRIDAGVLRDLDLTAAYGTEAACPRKGTARLPDPGSVVTEPQLDHVPAMPVQPTDQCDQGSCPAFVQVSIQTPAGRPAHAHTTTTPASPRSSCAAVTTPSTSGT